MGKAKPTKLSNKNLILSAIKQIEETTGFHIIDLEFGDTYFIASGPKDSICHFHIKEIPKFKFAFWNTSRFDKIEDLMNNDDDLWSDYHRIHTKTELIFFAQYERDIDKFKPSYSGFVRGMFRNAWYELNDKNRRTKVEEWYLDDVDDILKYMHKHPIKAYCYCQIGRDNIWNEISNFKALKEYIDGAFWYKVYKHKHKKRLRKSVKLAKSFIKKLKAMSYIVEVDYNNDVKVKLLDNQDVKAEDFEQDVNIIEEFQDKYFGTLDIEPWFIANPETQTEKRQNEDLHKRFYKYADTIYNILNGYSNETLEDYYVEKIVDMHVNKTINF